VEIVESRLYTRTMKISKHVHSCLLVEEKGKIVLVDPGNYSYDAKALDIPSLSSLDAIAITHEHMDHIYLPFLKEILAKFPNTPIYTNESVKKLLEKENIENAMTEGNEYITLHSVPHEKIWFGTPVENSMITLFKKFATVGDSLSFTESPDILALPVTAPWGSTTAAVEVALQVKPKVIFPIHDFMWKDDVRMGIYQRLKDFFGQHGIDFKAVETGEVVEI